MKQFIKKWNNNYVEDWGSITSDSFKQFARDLRSAIKRNLKKIDSQTELSSFNIGHYYISGFIRKNDKYVYFNYDCPRGDRSMDLNCYGPDGWLYRTAEHLKDFHGGHNNFCPATEFIPNVVDLLNAQM